MRCRRMCKGSNTGFIPIRTSASSTRTEQHLEGARIERPPLAVRTNVVEDMLGAFVPGAIIHRAPLGESLLSGLSFAAKDLFDVAGVVTGCGNPDWAATHERAKTDAWAVDALL